jgi:hypothetical protein
MFDQNEVNLDEFFSESDSGRQNERKSLLSLVEQPKMGTSTDSIE